MNTPLKAPGTRPGLLSRAELARFIRRVSDQLGFRVESDDFISVRDTGHGLQIRRKRAGHITVELELQYRWATALTCARVVDGGVAYKVSTDVSTYDNGTITETQTAAGGVHLLTPSDESYTCPELDVISDLDPEFDYGDLISTDPTVFSEVLDEDLLLPAAAAALEDDGSPYIALTRTWLDTVAPPTDIAQNLGSWSGATDPLLGRRIDSYRYRWKVTGPRPLIIEWEQGGGSLSTTVAPGGASSWYDDTIPATQGVADSIDNVVINLA